MTQQTNPVASAETWNSKSRCGGTMSHEDLPQKSGTTSAVTTGLPLTMVEPHHCVASPRRGGAGMATITMLEPQQGPQARIGRQRGWGGEQGRRQT